jgi:flavin-dependent dehydrogenase
VGYRDATVSDLKRLMSQPAFDALLPPHDVLARRYCRCRPRIGITPARRPFAERLVIVGDACCSRYFKNGIESAFLTARLAAEAAFNTGISGSAFRRAYWRTVKRTLVRDNIYGRLLFWVQDLAARHRLLAETYRLVASSPQKGDRAARVARLILWELLTGNAPYRTVFFRGFDPRLQARLTLSTLGLVVQRLRSVIPGGGEGPEHETQRPYR